MDTNRVPKQALQYRPKGRKNIWRPKKRWRDQLHFEDQGTGNTPNPSGTSWWWFFFRKSCLLWDNVEKYCRDGQATWQYGACALHAVYLSLQTHSQNTYVKLIDFPHCKKIVARTRITVRLYVFACLPCDFLNAPVGHFAAHWTPSQMNHPVGE